MSLIGVQPRPDILLTVMQDWPKIPEHFISFQLFPVFKVGVSTAPLPKVRRSANVERLYRPRYGQFPRSQTEVLAAGTYNCTEQGFEEPYDQKDIEIYKGEAGAQKVMGYMALNKVLIAHELGVVNSVMNTTAFPAGYNQAASAVWGTASDKPLNDVADAKQGVLLNCGQDANCIFFAATIYNKVRKSPQIQAQVRGIMGYTGKASGISIDITVQDLAIAFNVEMVYIGRARYNTADEGQTEVMAFIWPADKVLVAYIPSPEDPIAPHLGRTFVWDEGLMELGGQAQTSVAFDGVIMENYYEVQGNVGVMRARKFLDTLLLNRDSGFLLTGC